MRTTSHLLGIGPAVRAVPVGRTGGGMLLLGDHPVISGWAMVDGRAARRSNKGMDLHRRYPPEPCGMVGIASLGFWAFLACAIFDRARRHTAGEPTRGYSVLPPRRCAFRVVAASHHNSIGARRPYARHWPRRLLNLPFQLAVQFRFANCRAGDQRALGPITATTRRSSACQLPQVGVWKSSFRIRSRIRIIRRMNERPVWMTAPGVANGGYVSETRRISTRPVRCISRGDRDGRRLCG